MSEYADEEFDVNTTNWDGPLHTTGTDFFPAGSDFPSSRKRINPIVVEDEYHDGSTEVKEYTPIPSLVSDSSTTTTSDGVPSMDSEEISKLLMGKPSDVMKYHWRHQRRRRERDSSRGPHKSTLSSVSETASEADVNTDQGGSVRYDAHIVWPPMVLMMNTEVEKDVNNKWTGMNNQELLDLYRGSNAAEMIHSPGPDGHRGMCLLLYQASPEGYIRCVDLHCQLLVEGKGRAAWEKATSPAPDNCYGYLVTRKDIDIFNNQLPEEGKVRYMMKSFEEVAVLTPAEDASAETLKSLLGQLQELYRARIRLIRSDLAQGRQIFEDKLVRDILEEPEEALAEKFALVDKLESYESGKAALLRSHEEEKQSLEKKHVQEDFHQKRIHLEEIVDVEEKFSHDMSCLMRQYI